MVFRVSATMAFFCLLFSLRAVAHRVPHEAALATSAAVTAVEVDAVSEGEGLLLLPHSDESVVSDDGEVVEPVAEPDPDRSHPGSDGEEELTAKDLATEGHQQDGEKANEQIDDDEDEDDDEEENHGGDKEEKEMEKKKRKKHHDCDGKGKKEKKMKKHHQGSDKEEEEEEEKTKKKIHHRHHHVEKKKTKKLTTRHSKKDDSDDEGEQEKKGKRWRKAVGRSMFGHGRRSQREEAATEEVKN